MTERTFQLPSIPRRTRAERFGALELDVVDLSAAEIRSLFSSLGARTAGPRADVARRADALAAAARRFLDVGDPLRKLALSLLPRTSGFSAEMIEAALPLIFTPLGRGAIERTVAAAPGRVLSPLAVVSAGNLPGVAIPKLVLALAAGAACLVKTASGEPLLPVLFARAIAEADAELGERIAVVWWRGGDPDWEGALAAGAASLVAYGSDEAIASLAARAPGRFIAHGHRLSVALVRLEGGADIERLAESAALDVALYDQLGCLSPQCVYAVGGDGDRSRFADALAAALERLATCLPRGVVPETASAAIRRLRDEHEWKEIGAGGARVLASSRGTDWTVIDSHDPAFRSSALHRSVFVRPLRSIDALPGALGGALRRLECVGIGPWPDEAALSALAALRVARLSPLGRMQSPDLGWRQGGNDPMAGIVDGGEEGR